MKGRQDGYETVTHGLLSMFPSRESFEDFERESRSISQRAIPLILRHAFEAGVIEANTRAAFIEFLETHGSDERMRRASGRNCISRINLADPRFAPWKLSSNFRRIH